ncbi:hypothetical protein C438_14016 [Haloferax denitrificans ATCC 35960]|uniref:Uncharacterized protein n=1 Tax=Haloferax denitrificans ATCC 35960 TaxID=662478 RepID=M0J191_9EURY|nr:hypothetical protein C438_14016 [Haloferax denitrificans ATCC 35960]
MSPAARPSSVASAALGLASPATASVLGPGEHRLRLTLEADAAGSVVVIAPATANSSAA